MLQWNKVHDMWLSDKIKTGRNNQTHTFKIITVDEMFYPSVITETFDF